MKVPLKDPALPSAPDHNASSLSPINLTFKDVQSPADKAKAMTGTLTMHLEYQNKPFEAVPWLADHTAKEMVARGLPVTLTGTGSNHAEVLVTRMHVQNYRANAYSPFITFTSLNADVETPGGTRHITAYVKRGKVPVWGWEEIIDPTFNDALSVLTKELATKLNQVLFQQATSDDKVRALIAKIEKEDASGANSYLDVYQLGFDNNPIAVPALVKLSTHKNEYIRQAALSSIGILKATDQLNFLIDRYENFGGIWQDRAMALKAIGDLDTPEARAFLLKQQGRFQEGTDKEARWTNDIIALYLPRAQKPKTMQSAGSNAPTNGSSNANTAPAPVSPVPAVTPTTIAMDQPSNNRSLTMQKSTRDAAPVSVPAVTAASAPPTEVPASVTVTPNSASTSAPVAVSASASKANEFLPREPAMNAPSPATSAANPIDIQKVDFALGKSSGTVEHLGKQHGCISAQGAGLLTTDGPVEVYRLACNDGSVFIAKCEFRQCVQMSTN